MNDVVYHYFWIRNRNPETRPAEAWKYAIDIVNFFKEFA